jgi:hypothetical protein
MTHDYRFWTLFARGLFKIAGAESHTKIITDFMSFIDRFCEQIWLPIQFLHLNRIQQVQPHIFLVPGDICRLDSTQARDVCICDCRIEQLKMLSQISTNEDDRQCQSKEESKSSYTV